MKFTKENYNQLLPSLMLASKSLKGSERRMFLGRLALDLGRGGRSLICKTLNIHKSTLSKGIKEVKSGEPIKDRFNERGRKPLDQTFPDLLNSIKEIADAASQIDPKFTSTRLYTRLSASSLRAELLNRGYSEDELPTNQTLWNKLYQLGYKRRKVAKTKPKKN